MRAALLLTLLVAPLLAPGAASDHCIRLYVFSAAPTNRATGSEWWTDAAAFPIPACQLVREFDIEENRVVTTTRVLILLDIAPTSPSINATVQGMGHLGTVVPLWPARYEPVGANPRLREMGYMSDPLDVRGYDYLRVNATDGNGGKYVVRYVGMPLASG